MHAVGEMRRVVPVRQHMVATLACIIAYTKALHTRKFRDCGFYCQWQGAGVVLRAVSASLTHDDGRAGVLAPRQNHSGGNIGIFQKLQCHESEIKTVPM